MTKGTLSKEENVIIVGAGWAGLSAAAILAQNGIAVTVLEAAPQAGGRARMISFGKEELDNGQHLLLGAYQQTLALLNSIGIKEDRVFTRQPLRLWIESKDAGVDFKLNNLPFPLNLMMAFITSKGLSRKERSAALRFYRALTILQFEIKHDISVKELLLEYRQPVPLIEHLWEPLAKAALSTPIHEASAKVFLQVLKNTFAKQNSHSNFLFPKTHLSDVFPNPILHYLSKQQACVNYNERVESLIIENGVCKGVQTKKQRYEASEIILAIPPNKAAELLQPHLNHYPALRATQEKLQKFQYQPITTVYLEFDKPVQLPFPLLGFVGQTAHWLFDRATVSQANILSVVITGFGQHLDMNHASLVTILKQELKQNFLHLGEIQNFKVITEKKAAFSCHVGIEDERPTSKLAFPGLSLAGDYTQMGYPASLEAAVLSGKTAAELILSKRAITTI